MSLLAEIAKSKEEDNGGVEDEQFGIIYFLSSAPSSMPVVYKLLPLSLGKFIITHLFDYLNFPYPISPKPVSTSSDSFMSFCFSVRIYRMELLPSGFQVIPHRLETSQCLVEVRAGGWLVTAFHRISQSQF